MDFYCDDLYWTLVISLIQKTFFIANDQLMWLDLLSGLLLKWELIKHF